MSPVVAIIICATLLLLYILFCVWGVKNKKKSKETFLEQSKPTIIKEYKDRTEFVASSPWMFEKYYDVFADDIVPEHLIGQELPQDISEFKEKYTNLVYSLIGISVDNTVFFTSAEEWDNFRKKHSDHFEQEAIISKDIIRTVPFLAQYMDMHKFLYINRQISIKLLDVHCSLWSGLDYIADKDDGSDEYKRNKSFLECSLKNCWNARDICVRDDAINNFFSGATGVATKLIINSEKMKEAFLAVYNEDENLRNMWLQIYYNGMKAAENKRGYMCHFKQYFDMHREMDRLFEDYKWYDDLSLFGSLSIHSSLGAVNEHTHDEYIRILKLYTSGQMKGEYSKFRDPKYIAENK